MSNAFKRSFSKLTGAVGFQNQVKSDSGNLNEFLSADARMLLEALPDCASLHTANGDALWVSENTEQAFNKASDGLLGKGFLDSVNPQDKLVVLQTFSKCDVKGQNQTISFRCQFPTVNGTVEVSRFELRVSKFRASEKLLYLAVLRDITHEEKVITKAKEETEKAQSSNSTKSLFLSNMNHELRTPLNAIIGFSQMLMGEAALVVSEEKKAEYTGLIYQSSTHLLNIINDILDLSKIEAGQFQIIPEVIDVSEAIQSTLQLMEPIASGASVSISADIADELPKITADPRAVRQIIINLVANAVKFSSEGSSVGICATRNRRKINIEISDRGLGMNAETIEQLGKSFFQAEQSTSKRFEGTGLGLSIVFGLVKLHGGEVSFKSQLGEGTTVCVELPISNEKSIPIPSDPNEAIVFLNQAKEPNLLRKLETNSTVRKAG